MTAQEFDDNINRCYLSGYHDGVNTLPHESYGERFEKIRGEMLKHDAEIRDGLRACVKAMNLWASQEDGLPEGHGIGAFEAVQAANKLLGD
jgi:hypothetical protein